MSEVLLDIEDPQQLQAYLKTKEYVSTNEQIFVKPLAGGVSNRTMLVKLSGGRAWVIKQALPKLRVAIDWYSDPARIHREAQGLRRLIEITPSGSITPLVFEDQNQHVLAMQAVPEPHENWKSCLLTGNVDNELVKQFGRLLASIHSRATERRQLLAAEFSDRSFFESLRLEPYYAYAAQQLPVAAEFIHGLIDKTRRRSDTLVHGDYSPKNILVYSNRMILLDHEVIHWGEPAFDLGFALTHFISKAHHLSCHRSEFADAAKLFWRTYRNHLSGVAWASDLESRTVRHTLACLLARVVGRSPLEYLDHEKQARQAQVVATLIRNPPDFVEFLVDAFLERIEHDEPHQTINSPGNS